MEDFTTEMIAVVCQLDGMVAWERRRLRREVRNVNELGWISWREIWSRPREEFLEHERMVYCTSDSAMVVGCMDG